MITDYMVYFSKRTTTYRYYCCYYYYHDNYNYTYILIFITVWR